MNGKVRKVGRISVAVGLIALGGALLMDNLLASPGYTSWILRFWPALLIGFGAEYLIFSALDRGTEGEPTRLRFDFGGGFLLFLLIVLIVGLSTLRGWLPNAKEFVMVTPGTSSRQETAEVPAADAKAVAIDIELGQVELYSHGLSEVRVDASYNVHGLLLRRDDAEALDQFKLTAEGGETIQVRGTVPPGDVGGVSATYRIYVPEKMKVSIRTGAGSVVVRDYTGDLKVNSHLGSISVMASEGRLDLEGNSGSITVSDFTGPVVAKTNLGRLEVNRVKGELQLDSGTGSIQVRTFSGGKLVAETRTGSIHIDTQATLDGDLLLRTSTGSITLFVPSDSSMKVSAKTGTGSISAPPPFQVSRNGTASSLVGTLGTGEQTVTLETGMGSIHLDLR